MPGKSKKRARKRKQLAAAAAAPGVEAGFGEVGTGAGAGNAFVSNNDEDDLDMGGASERRVRRGPGLSTAEAIAATESHPTDDLVFEDPFGDDMEEEEVVETAEDAEMKTGDDVETTAETQTWQPGMPLPEGTHLEYESEAYNMYHSMRHEWPCLSFDVLPDRLGMDRSRFPHTAYIVAGTQADSRLKNSLNVIKVSDLCRTVHDGDSEESDSEAEEDPKADYKSFSHVGAVNRVRVMPQEPHITASWSETGKVHLWDVRPLVAGLDNPAALADMRVAINAGPRFTFPGHSEEGYAMDWSPKAPGRLATGDCKRNIYIWDAATGGKTWGVDKVPYVSHKGSVEDIQWSPTEPTVFASGGVDGAVHIWDTRSKAHTSMAHVQAHDMDVNVISWNRSSADASHLLATGSDDCSFKVFDLRYFGRAPPVAHFKWHTKPIVSVEWHPTDETSLAVASADDQVTLWDMSVEADTESNESKDETLQGIPPQLLFIHQGQHAVKEAHHHKQIPGMVISTALDGFNFFIPNFAEKSK